MRALGLNGGHHVRAALAQLEHLRQHGHGVLAVGVHHGHPIALRGGQPRAQGRFLAEIARKGNKAQRHMGGQARLLGAAGGIHRVTAAVIDHNPGRCPSHSHKTGKNAASAWASL